MKISRSSSTAKKSALWTSIVLSLGALGATSAAQLPSSAGTPVYSCVVDISFQAQSGVTETYQQTFEVMLGSSFTDDFSTPTRMHVFTAEVVQRDGEDHIDFDYFSDVSALSTIDLSSTLGMTPNQKREDTSGRHYFYDTHIGSYSVTYDLHCVKH